MPDPVGLVIFDCDGVLVDTERLAVRVTASVGERLGWPLTEAEIVDLFLGRSPRYVRDLVAARLGDEVAAVWAAQFDAAHREEAERYLTPVDGIVEALDEITVPTCVASNGPHEKMRHTLGRTGLYERFAGRVFSAGDVPRGKPAPDLFLHAAASMGVPPRECVVVEDSRAGVDAARAAGMRCLGYAGGLSPADWLAGPGTVVFDDMRELPVLLGMASTRRDATGTRRPG
ncbi:MAG TPA: HAD family hydrolase [Micromonosporaceae bacterium]